MGITLQKVLLSKHQTLKQCCFDVGPESVTLAKHQNNIDSTSRVCRSCPYHVNTILWRRIYLLLLASVSLSVYYVAVRTIVLSRRRSNLARPVIIHDVIHGFIYVPSTLCCGFFGVSPDGNCAHVHWGSFTSNSKSVRRAI